MWPPGGAGASVGGRGRTGMPRWLVWARAGLFAQAGLSLLGVLAIWLGVGEMSARLAGALVFAALPAVLGLVLCRVMWKRGGWIPWLVLGVQACWFWRSLGFLAEGSWRGVTQLLLPVAIGWLVARPQVREWFALAPEDRAVRPEFSLPHMMTWRRDRGQSSTEYVGMLIVVVAVIGSLLTAGFTTEIGSSFRAAVCRVIGAACGDADAGGDEAGSSQSDGRTDPTNTSPQDEPQPDSRPGPKKPEKEDRNALEKGLDWFKDEVVDPVADTAEEFGGGVKDKFVEEYVDGPKQLIEGVVDDPLGTGKKLVTGVFDQVKRPFVETYDACKKAAAGFTIGSANSCGWKAAGLFTPAGAVDLIVDDDVKQSVTDGNWGRAGGEFVYNGVTTVLPIMKAGKGFSLIKKVNKGNKKPDAENGKPKGEPKDKPDEEESERKPVTCPTKHSFPPGTRVLAGGGLSLPIEAVRLGEQVLATDPVTGLTTLRTVTRTFTTYDDKHFTRLTTPAGTVTATDTHPFWLVDEHRWADAGDIKPGDQLRLPSGSTLQVTAVTRYTQRQTTHDLTVADLHTYYVLAGRTPVLVHNSSPFCGRPFGNRAGGDDFHGSDYSLDEIVQFVHGHTGGGNPAMGRPSQAEIETTLRKAGPVRIGKQNSAQFDHGGVRVIVNYDMPWKSTAYYPGSLGKS